ncbi:MAG: dihydroorotate dehydrogenase electron transfer subunit [Candidatus Hodarchaeota archaeon]
MTENIIKTVKIQRITNECNGVKTLFFNMKEGNKDYITPKPGQFVMIWVPGVDEVPMSISGYDEFGNWNITVKNVGECTNAIHNLKLGDFIGVRGPLGNCFPLPTEKSKKIFLIGGGIGMAALKSLSTELINKKHKITVIEGAKFRNNLMYMDEFQGYNKDSTEFHYCTDDGSYGEEGFASDIFKDIIKDYSQKNLSNLVVYACGPELMLYALLQICTKNKIEYYASLERIMRCGCGLCGLCALDPLGLLVCKDGPVFNSDKLKKIEDFGKFKRDFTGNKIPLM